MAVSACGSEAGTPGAEAAGGASATSSAPSVTALLDPTGFAAAVAEPGRFVLNVHVPDEGAITGTDAAIPYDRIGEGATELPQDTDTPIAIYCKSGRMSAIAGTALRQLGYTDVVELRGGMDAWVASGRPLLAPGP